MSKTKHIIILFLFLLITVPAFAKDFVLVIDAGHGGHDHGAIGDMTNEKSINLAVAKQFGEMVTKHFKNVKVVYTRDNDSFISLSERAKKANNVKGDLFVAIHVNSVAKTNKNRTSVEGAEVYTLGLHRTADNLAVAQKENSVIEYEKDTDLYKDFDPNSPESYILFELAQGANMDKSISFAEMALKELTTTGGRKNKGVKQAGFWVLWATNMPSVLVELDFICNPQSEKFLASKEGQEKMARSLFNAFSDYLAENNEFGKADSRNKKSSNNEADKTRQTPPPPKSFNLNRKRNGNPAVGIDYRIQILTSDVKLNADSKDFKGFKDVDFYQENNAYKYTVGHSDTRDDAEEIERYVKNKFPQAFIVKFVDGKKVKL